MLSPLYSVRESVEDKCAHLHCVNVFAFLLRKSKHKVRSGVNVSNHEDMVTSRRAHWDKADTVHNRRYWGIAGSQSLRMASRAETAPGHIKTTPDCLCEEPRPFAFCSGRLRHPRFQQHSSSPLLFSFNLALYWQLGFRKKTATFWSATSDLRFGYSKVNAVQPATTALVREILTVNFDHRKYFLYVW